MIIHTNGVSKDKFKGSKIFLNSYITVYPLVTYCLMKWIINKNDNLSNRMFIKD